MRASAGSGGRAKLAINLILGINRAGLAEGLVFAQALGLDPGAFLKVARESAAGRSVLIVAEDNYDIGLGAAQRFASFRPGAMAGFGPLSSPRLWRGSHRRLRLARRHGRTAKCGGDFPGQSVLGDR